MNELQALETLKSAKIPQGQATAIIKVLGDLESRAVTRADLKVLKAELVIHIYSAVGLAIAILSFIKFFEA